MKMIRLLRSMSRTVHEEHRDEEDIKSSGSGSGACTSLTVWRKSLLFSCNGFTVIDSDGNLVYRVDNYIGGQRPQEVILMDGLGKTVLTIHRRPKKLRLQDNWLVYEGEVGDCCNINATTKPSKEPIWCVRKHINILHNANRSLLARVFRETSSDKRHAYVIEGSYAHRSCKVLDESRKVVAEIKRKEAMIGGISFGVEVFLLIVWPGFDRGFAMALVLLLDQMFS